MQPLSARVVYESHIPEVPYASEQHNPMFFHPSDKTLWVFSLARPMIHRIARDGTATLLAEGDDLRLPEAFDASCLLAASFWFDARRGAPVFLAACTNERVGTGLLLAVWSGKGFELIAQENGIRVATSDSFAFDPVRGVLVHFAGQSDMDSDVDEERKKRGGLTVRELGPDGVFRDVGEPLPEMGTRETYAGFDARLGRAVVIDEYTQRTFGWDGAQWSDLGELPTSPSAPWICTNAPRTKGLVFVHQRAHNDVKAVLWELGEQGWQSRETHGLEIFGGAAYDPEGDETWVFGPWWGAGTLQHTLGRYDGEAIVPAGAPVRVVSRGSAGGTPHVWGARKPGGFSIFGRRAYRAPYVARIEGGAFVDRPFAPPVLGLCAAGEGVAGVGFEGEVFRLEGDTWKCIAKPPSGFAERSETNLGADGRGRIFVVSGEPAHGNKRLADAWLFDGKWAKVSAKGTVPTSIGASVGFDADRQVWLVVGGDLKNGQADPKTHECDGKKWASFATRHRGDGIKSVRVPGGVELVAWDEASRQLLMVVLRDVFKGPYVYVYRGEGVWDCIASLERTRFGGAFAYDGARRAIVAASNDGLAEFELGAALDAARPPAAGEKKAKKPVKTEGAKAAPAEAPIAKEVWLRLEEGESDKFWFAARSGATWTARWGHRGKKPTEKVHELETAAAAKAAYEKAVREKLAKGYEHTPEREEAAKIPGRMAFYMKLGKKGDDTFGGMPKGVGKGAWPVCTDCGHPMPHVLLFHAHEERLPLHKHAALAVFACNGAFSGGSCRSLEPNAGCNAALLLTAKQLGAKPLAAPPKGPEGQEPPAVMKARRIDYTPHFEADPARNENPEDPEETSKVSGYPAWLQGDQTPKCSACKSPMRFVAQLGELDEAINFGGGDAFVFCCPEEHEAKFLWQQ